MITLNGIPAESLGVVFSPITSFPAPQLRKEEVIVPGRDGVLWRDDHTMAPVELLLDGHVLDGSRAAFFDWCRGGGKLIFDEQPDRYRKASFLSLDTSYLSGDERLLSFQLRFSVDPFARLLSGDATTTYGKTIQIVNPYPLDAYPSYTITGSGEITIKQSGRTVFKVKDVVDRVELEAESDLVHRELVSLEKQASGEIPILRAGEMTELSVEGNVTDVKITPHWRVL